MAEHFPSLERGEPAIETKRKHVPVQLFKQATRLNAELERFQKLMADMNILNIHKKREELVKEIGKWLPKVGSFTKQINQVKKGNGDLLREIQALQGENTQLSAQSWDSRMELAQSQADYSNLSRSYNDLRDFIRAIPEDLRNELKAKYHHLQKVEQDMELER